MSPEPTTQSLSPAIRGFLRSLNILLKAAQMYGMDHAQTTSKSKDVWSYLQTALSEGKQKSLQLAVSEKRLLVDGVAIKSGPTEQSIAHQLSAADLASITITPQVAPEAFSRMVQIFAENASDPERTSSQLKASLGNDPRTGIRFDEVRFVKAGSERPQTFVAAGLLAQFLGTDSAQVPGLLNNPNKLLQFLTVAGGPGEGSGTGTSPGIAADTATAAEGAVAGPGPAGATINPPEIAEEDTATAIRLLVKLAREGGDQGSFSPAQWREEFSQLPQRSQAVLHGVLEEFARAIPPKQAPPSMLLQLAEHLALRLAMERYECSESRVDVASETLKRMNIEIEILRQVLGTCEGRLKEAGFDFGRPSDSLELEFWARMSAPVKLDALLSDQAWRIPSLLVRQYVEQLVSQNEVEKLQLVLLNYVIGIHNSSSEARRRTALGLKDLAGFYPRPVGQALADALRHVGEQLAAETEPELQKLISATFVLLGQEAATRRRYAAVLQMLTGIESIDARHPELAASLRARIGLENRIPDFLEEVLRVPEVPDALEKLLRRMPKPTVEHVAGRISRCVRRRERERLVAIAQELGPAAASALREVFDSGPPAGAVNTVGLLSRLEPAALEESLRTRLLEWSPIYHDAVVRQIASAGAPGRGRLLGTLLGALDPLVAPLAVEEIGISGDAAAAPLLLGIAGGELPKFNSPFLRVKAIEALGRLRVKEAVPFLRALVECKAFGGLLVPRELRIVAAQSLHKIDLDAAKGALQASGLKHADLEPLPADHSSEAPGVRQRNYPRTRLPRELPGRINTSDGEYSAAVRELSLGGGLCSCEHRLHPGTPAVIRIKTGLRSFSATIIVRDARSELVAFEIVDMDLEDRTKLRTLLQGIRRQ
jgi:hypothetical protein